MITRSRKRKFNDNKKDDNDKKDDDETFTIEFISEDSDDNEDDENDDNENENKDDNKDKEKEKNDEEETSPKKEHMHPADRKFKQGNGSIGVILGNLFGNPMNRNAGPSKKDLLMKKINDSFMDDNLKLKLKLKLTKSYLDDKQTDWFESIINIPFGKYTPLPVDSKNEKEIHDYFIKIMNILDNAVYGMENVKEEIINYLAQSLTTTRPSPRILALHGIAGVGKTKIIREGLSKSLNRPLNSFSMGGIKDSSHFSGFDYTYAGSRHGAITQCLIESKVMNPIIFFDELDKISNNADGKEVENLLIHLTDPIQNYDFKDKYFSDISIDLSKVIFIFAFNDIDNISPILKDRLHIINILPPTNKEKLVIIKKYIIDDVLKNIGLNKDDFIITDEAITFMIDTYSRDNNKGMRELKRCIETILLKINTIKLLGNTLNEIKLSFSKKISYQFPILVDQSQVELFLKNHHTEDDEISKYNNMYM